MKITSIVWTLFLFTWFMAFDEFETVSVEQVKTTKDESSTCSTGSLENDCRDERRVFYPLRNSLSGAIRTIGTGVTVQRGTRGTLSFSITVQAVRADELADMDSKFIETLSVADRSTYVLGKQSYSGDLSVPFLRFVGADLRKNVTECDMQVARVTQSNYTAYARVASYILQRSQIKTLRISGSRGINGTSFIPRTVVAYIQVAEVTLLDGTCKRVVSTSADDVIVGTKNEVAVDTGADELIFETIDG
ncbi:hypothetical protein BWQ96_07748 [Gracilariopsis chorda]|uniref:Auto-transporter adhesin head GIN domain-containing protein n=1 Tax=Gracilariopsis chorda TaxID=448386 RepID=A0A2V3IKD7_9FLOR|nr:hypothetical protein BWQ96_07748 [Gracilariopsis chorda]|eukprot:PXF42531.1 hypothetical protein BWQ96_07748 [Gracilariopsis chorda]